MITQEFLKECTKINNKNKSLGFGFSPIDSGRNSMVICIGHKHLKQTFFCVLTEKKNENDNTQYKLYLLKNDNKSSRELLGIYNDAHQIRLSLINIIKDIYTLEKSEKSKEYCYPRYN